jgi:hypothetical protein
MMMGGGKESWGDDLIYSRARQTGDIVVYVPVSISSPIQGM